MEKNKIEMFRGEYTDKLMKRIFKELKENIKNKKRWENKCPKCDSNYISCSTHGDGCFVEQTETKKIYYIDVHLACYSYTCNDCKTNFTAWSWFNWKNNKSEKSIPMVVEVHNNVNKI